MNQFRLCTILLLAGTAYCMFSVAANSTSLKSIQPTLHGRLAASEEIDRLQGVGIKCLLKVGSPDLLLVDDVRMGSSAFYKGVQKGDNITSINITPDGLTVDLLRNQMRYRVFFRSKQNVSSRNGATSADKYLQSLEADILATQLQRRKVEQEEKSAANGTSEEQTAARKNTSDVKVGEHLVKPEEVFKTKSKAVKQGHVPNCWFEASLAAVAESPEGHRLIADLITKTGNSNYRVTFPKGGFSGDCPWVNVTVDDLTAFELQDKALWARVLDCACQKKYPNNIGVEKTNGLKILTGMPVHIISPTAESGLVNETLQRVTDKKWPTIMGTSTDSISASLTPWHAYSLVAYDRDSQVATIRNPVGGDPLYFQPPDLEHVKPITENEDGVRLLGDGLIQVSLKAVVDNFNGIVWAER